MHIVGWIVFGLVVGIVAKFLMPGRDPGGFVITAILGFVGALVGGFVGRLIGWYGEGAPVGFVMAVVGSIILLAIYRFAFARTMTVWRSRSPLSGAPADRVVVEVVEAHRRPRPPRDQLAARARQRARRSQREEIPG